MQNCYFCNSLKDPIGTVINDLQQPNVWRGFKVSDAGICLICLTKPRAVCYELCRHYCLCLSCDSNEDPNIKNGSVIHTYPICPKFSQFLHPYVPLV